MSKSIKTNSTKVIAPSRDITSNDIPSHYFQFQSYVSDTHSSHMLKEMYENEFNESNSEKKALSREDELFLQTMENGLRKENGHYILPLPFRNTHVKLPDNRDQAIRRLHSLKRRLQLNPVLHKQYTKSMNKLIDRGYARVANKDNDIKGRKWLIPHHAVVDKRKPDPRLVFDCNAKFQGKCLNE